MFGITTEAELLDLGYRPGAPSTEAAMIDAEQAENMICPNCGKRMQYDPWAQPGSYIALAVCRCGFEQEF